MAGETVLDDALARLEAAIGRVEGAVDQRLEHAGKIADLESELQQLGTDRSRLAQALDAAEARSGRIEEANQDVSRRLVSAMETIRGVLERNSH
ncbi:DUF4164 domain-containing protein [Bauldia sp.]|uniref:DUF4164 domain-containing protein n=1 Tax=Bauldia sp. TaxID=2575872 RepID=UPI003BAB2D4A